MTMTLAEAMTVPLYTGPQPTTPEGWAVLRRSAEALSVRTQAAELAREQALYAPRIARARALGVVIKVGIGASLVGAVAGKSLPTVARVGLGTVGVLGLIAFFLAGPSS